MHFSYLYFNYLRTLLMWQWKWDTHRQSTKDVRDLVSSQTSARRCNSHIQTQSCTQYHVCIQPNISVNYFYSAKYRNTLRYSPTCNNNYYYKVLLQRHHPLLTCVINPSSSTVNIVSLTHYGCVCTWMRELKGHRQRISTVGYKTIFRTVNIEETFLPFTVITIFIAIVSK